MTRTFERLAFLFGNVIALGVATQSGCGNGGDGDASADGGDVVPPIGDAGCGIVTDAAISEEGYEPIACPDGGTNDGTRFAAGLTSAAADGWELRLRQPGLPVEDGGATYKVIAKGGSPCSTASDKAVCEASFKTLEPSPTDSWNIARECLESPRDFYLVTSKGNELAVVPGLDAATEFFAPFLTPAAAAWLVEQYGWTIDCARRTVRVIPGEGVEVLANKGSTCGSYGVHRFRLFVHPNGGLPDTWEDSIIQEGDPNCVCGRRPEAFEPRRGTRDESLGERLARMTELEAASVPAFQRLASELRAHGAPDDLVRRAEAAAEDEIRHTYMMRRESARFGGTPTLPALAVGPVRSLAEIARENMVEGCVREALGALSARLTAERSPDPTLRDTFSGIAKDETEHAALAIDVARWLDPRLDEASRRDVLAAKVEAIDAIERSLDAMAKDDPIFAWPEGAAGRAMFDAMKRELWGVA